MAEIGIIASALQIADIGIRLSLRLYTFGETVASADKSIISISENVSLTSTVLKELGQTLDKDQTTRICSPNAVRTADSIVKQCQRIFQEMDYILVKKFAKVNSAEKDRKIKSAQTLERLRWPFIKGKIELLTSDLERQKSTLVLMLNVIALAKQEFEKTEASTTIAEQRSLIQDLARSNEGYIHKFEQLRLSCSDVPTDQEVISADCNGSIPTLQAPTAQGFVGVQNFRPYTYQRPYTLVPPPDGMRWLLQHYDNLLRALLKQVSEPKYEIAEESRSRIKADIVTSHGREMRHTEQAGCSGASGLAKSSRFDVQQTPTTNPAALNSWGPSAASQSSSQGIKSMQPLNIPKNYILQSSRSPRVMTNLRDATRSEKEDDRPAQPEDQYQEIALTRKLKAPGSDLPAVSHVLAQRKRRRREMEGYKQTVPSMTQHLGIESSNPHSSMRQQPLPSTIQHSDNEASRSRPPSPFPNSPGTVQQSKNELPYPGLPILQQPLASTVQHSENVSSNPGPVMCQLYAPSMVQLLGNGYSKRRPPIRLPTLPSTVQHSENESSNPACQTAQCFSHRDYSEEHTSVTVSKLRGGRRVRPRKRPRRFDDDTTEDSAENVVDRLLATWTTLPVPASRTVSHQNSFSLVDLE